MRKEIEALIFSDVSSYDIYVNTGVNQGLMVTSRWLPNY